jgi:two-component system OmpR family sensor kinase
LLIASLARHLLELFGQAKRLLVVARHQQAQRQIRRRHPSRGVELGRDAEGDVARRQRNFARNLGERRQRSISLDAAGLIHVMNDGPAVPPERLTRLTERFERAGAEVPGAGLGLAIVESIMAQAGGSLELHSPARGRRDGFEAILRLDLGERAEI